MQSFDSFLLVLIKNNILKSLSLILYFQHSLIYLFDKIYVGLMTYVKTSQNSGACMNFPE